MVDIFIADAHLNNPEDKNYKLLLSFLGERMGAINNLYLLGDIFRFWIGYKHAVFSPYVPLLNVLEKLVHSGTKITFVEGNHDFHIGPYFTEKLNATVLPMGGEILCGNKRVYICHGDTLVSDFKYTLLRSFLRSNLIKSLQKILPVDLTWSIAERLNQGSDRRHESTENYLPKERLKVFTQALFTKGFDAVVLGHFHVPSYNCDTEGRETITLGDWIESFSYIEAKNEELSLLEYK